MGFFTVDVCGILLVLVLVRFFSQLDARESHLGRGSISGGIAFLSVSKSGAFSRFMADVGGPSLLWIDSPGQGILYKKSG